MTASSHEEPARPVEAEIVNEIPGENRGSDPESGSEKKKSFFHPGSGLAIIGIDVAAFGLNAPTGLLATPLIAVGAFITTFAIVFGIQKNQAQDSTGWAMLKALIGGVAAGVPMPIAGTVLGAAILMLSGLPTSTSKVVDKFRG